MRPCRATRLNRGASLVSAIFRGKGQLAAATVERLLMWKLPLRICPNEISLSVTDVTRAAPRPSARAATSCLPVSFDPPHAPPRSRNPRTSQGASAREWRRPCPGPASVARAVVRRWALWLRRTPALPAELGEHRPRSLGPPE